MTKSDEQRTHPRFSSTANLKIYTSVVNTPYTVDLKDVSRSGLFIQTLHLPRLGETITYNLIDEAGRKIRSGQGKIVRLRTTGRDSDLGFAVELDGLLRDDTVSELSSV